VLQVGEEDVQHCGHMLDGHEDRGLGREREEEEEERAKYRARKMKGHFTDMCLTHMRVASAHKLPGEAGGLGLLGLAVKLHHGVGALVRRLGRALQPRLLVGRDEGRVDLPVARAHDTVVGVGVDNFQPQVRRVRGQLAVEDGARARCCARWRGPSWRRIGGARSCRGRRAGGARARGACWAGGSRKAVAF
jgi:hypothetical protein